MRTSVRPAGERDHLLIVTDVVDPHADVVVRECLRRGMRVVRLHPRDYPSQTQITLRTDGARIVGEIRTPVRNVSLERIGYCWFRKPVRPCLPPSVPAEAQEYALLQFDTVLRSLYAALAGRWLVDPVQSELARMKLVQAARASECGLDVPETLLTNSPQDAEAFRADHGGRVLTKAAAMPIVSPNIEGRWVMPLAQLWDRPVDPAALSACPAMYQPYLEKTAEVRSVVIGDEVFSAAVDGREHPTRPVDIRSVGLDLPYRPHELPAEVAAGLVKLVHGFDLEFCSADLVRTRDGRYVFLDLNPNGQWLWLEREPSNLPLTTALVDLFERRLAVPREP